MSDAAADENRRKFLAKLNWTVRDYVDPIFQTPTKACEDAAPTWPSLRERIENGDCLE